MTVLDITERYVDPDCTYDFWLRPQDVPDLQTAQQKGMNCVVLAHLVMKEMFDYELPPDLRCTEMFLDSTHFVRTEFNAEQLRPGDLVWFGRAASRVSAEQFKPSYDQSGHMQNWRDFPVNHVGIYVGRDAQDEAQILHSVARENTTLWPLRKFGQVPRYSIVWGSSRLLAATTVY